MPILYFYIVLRQGCKFEVRKFKNEGFKCKRTVRKLT